ncbi:MAG: hypothetical protein HY586_03625 [Candidatus Omnitrophica bacterium]|nr:hypothetical protein [Candidatus Omnitrophota bacterium]
MKLSQSKIACVIVTACLMVTPLFFSGCFKQPEKKPEVKQEAVLESAPLPRLEQNELYKKFVPDRAKEKPAYFRKEKDPEDESDETSSENILPPAL